ncbi:MAG: HD domain-containing protein [Cytophagaceae bacterium]|nr:HD domain-containing protein [Gemmatimonadaceae bacterium]
MPGYSDRINHALAFAAKHHDQQVRRGIRAPYLTQPANVAIILTRYGQDESTVIAGILHDVVDDWARDGYSREVLQQRLSDKFGEGVLGTLLSVTHRKADDEGVELNPEERRNDLITRMAKGTPASWWVCTADKLHAAASLVTDVRRTVEPASVWNRLSGGREATVRWHRRVHDRLASLGFDAPIMAEFEQVVRELESLPA